MRFADVKSDIAFKKVFANENRKEILISFINAVLGLEGDKKIADIIILNPYQAPKIASLKETTLDIRAKSKEGVTFIVEIQVQKKVGFAKRVLFYTGKAYVGQLEKGDDYPKLNQVIFIGITDFDVFEGDKYLTQHLILNTATHIQELKGFEFNFIELTKFDKRENDLETIVDKWIYFIKNAGELKLMPKNADFMELKEAYETADTMLWTKEELDVYDYWLMKEQDERGAIEYSFLEGQRKGLLKGKEEGLTEGLLKGKEEGLTEGLIKGKEEGLTEGLLKGKEEGLTEGLIKGKEEGLTEGLLKGKEEGLTEGLIKGKEEGLTEGLLKGKEEGKREGLLKGKREGLLEGIRGMLEIKYEEIAASLIASVKRISSVEDLAKLKTVIMKSASIEEIKEYLNRLGE
ncbi:transposase [Candidatus Magnetoovum chiemensis]|nr:transposase [Candidatus Magnetoovum chiemensis]